MILTSFSFSLHFRSITNMSIHIITILFCDIFFVIRHRRTEQQLDVIELDIYWGSENPLSVVRRQIGHIKLPVFSSFHFKYFLLRLLLLASPQRKDNLGRTNKTRSKKKNESKRPLPHGADVEKMRLLTRFGGGRSGRRASSWPGSAGRVSPELHRWRRLRACALRSSRLA